MASSQSYIFILCCLLGLIGSSLIFYPWTILTISGLILLSVVVYIIYGIIKVIMPGDGCISSSNKAVLITGCDSGFGNLLARKLDTIGYTVFAGCLFPSNNGATDLEETTSDNVHVIKLDVTNDMDVSNAVNYIKEKLRKTNAELWSVVNNAGLGIFIPLEWVSVEKVEEVMSVNAIGPVRVTKAFLPLLRQSRGRVVNMASAAGRMCAHNFIPYSMSKHAVVAFSEGLRLELAQFGIKVASIEPGLYKTSMSEIERLSRAVRQEWDKLTSDTKSVYGERYVQATIDQISAVVMKDGSDNIGDVINAMEHAITSTNPRFIYAPPEPLSQIQRLLLSILPQAMKDRALARYKAKAKPAFC